MTGDMITSIWIVAGILWGVVLCKAAYLLSGIVGDWLKKRRAGK